jgi:siroheme synthase
VVYMPGRDLSALQQRLVSSGVAPQTACAIISGATSESEEVHVTSVANLFAAPQLSAPRLLVVGEVVRLAGARQVAEQFRTFSMGTQYSEVSPNTGENPS